MTDKPEQKMPEPSSFHNSQPLQVKLENIPQTKHDAYGVPYQIPASQSFDSQGNPTMYTQMSEHGQTVLLPRYTYGQQQFSQPVQYIVQPGSRYISQQIDGYRPVRDYLGLSIFATLCCCFPLGIGAIIASYKARTLADQGQYAGAQRSSRCALQLIITSIILGALIITAFIVYRTKYVNAKMEQDVARF
ncbi:synapse differentiation-inducing gene protein 1-like [Biomphalaria glabrata]|uniref:Synapse differentiation-inducing gene protein 1-like n=1 Tax=Biomphalaria glabrata TaxID=6526 RepID=A0A9W3AWQ3_BIOGL|nr:synapse differentiation-inducing gene protein 1-like [Biomphalaria glabrata]XP_055891650.1 synapse differentiation-inducing gene protein 1-like [Biomphalaria glabrata]